MDNIYLSFEGGKNKLTFITIIYVFSKLNMNYQNWSKKFQQSFILMQIE
jgi:hypothetical protein